MSPLFLFAAPWNSSTQPCTISAIWLTKFIIFDCSTSVATLKSRIFTLPIMHSTRTPGIMALTPALSEPCMLAPIMFAPASPKPSASREPSLMIVFSRMTVSMGSLTVLLHFFAVNISWMPAEMFSRVRLLILAFATSSALNSSSAIFIAMSGFSRIASTRLIMFSTGVKTRLLASLENDIAATHSTKQMKPVMIRLKPASRRVKGRKSK
mmetsp:Transcript_134813/g.252095  ORF Transcript_134813/g.252095 Transcript_134813/m.252095 type:complete len:210 (+) Transcript_134813:1088-1717(+)